MLLEVRLVCGRVSRRPRLRWQRDAADRPPVV